MPIKGGEYSPTMAELNDCDFWVAPHLVGDELEVLHGKISNGQEKKQRQDLAPVPLEKTTGTFVPITQTRQNHATRRAGR